MVITSDLTIQRLDILDENKKCLGRINSSFAISQSNLSEDLVVQLEMNQIKKNHKKISSTSIGCIERHCWFLIGDIGEARAMQILCQLKPG